MSFPRVSLAFLSWNRLHYLKATLLSARECIDYPNLEWIVSDNHSVEPGLREFVDSCDWIEHRWFQTQTHAEAMNQIVERCTGEYVLIWPEDVQFVIQGPWMKALISAMEENPWLGSVGLNFLRRKTCRRLLGPAGFRDIIPMAAELRRRLFHFRRPRSVSNILRTPGWRLPGVVASGIPSLTKTSCWKKLGPWKTRSGPGSIIDSSLGAEDDMIHRFQNSGFSWQQGFLVHPVAADIINDDTGCKAKVRKGVRYGIYTPPASGKYYYELMKENDLRREGEFPACFEDNVRPVGFRLPLDENGDLKKASFNDTVKTPVGEPA